MRPNGETGEPAKLACYHGSLRIGIHTSIAGSLERAALKAAELGANTFQIFSQSPRMWRAAARREDEVKALRAARERLDLAPLIIHANYLVNLGAADPEVRERSLEAFRGELERADAIGAEYLVVHPGSYRGQSLEEGMAAVVLALESLGPSKTMILLENTVGCGAQIGRRFEELRFIRDRVDRPLGYCLDTCHLLGAGFDVATGKGLEATVREAGRVLGMENVKVIHANDSKTPLGSHIDRHANIGEGHIGATGFRRILAHPELRTKPFILETPVDKAGDDRRNVETLKRLCRKSRTTTARSS